MFLLTEGPRLFYVDPKDKELKVMFLLTEGPRLFYGDPKDKELKVNLLKGTVQRDF